LSVASWSPSKEREREVFYFVTKMSTAAPLEVTEEEQKVAGVLRAAQVPEAMRQYARCRLCAHQEVEQASCPECQRRRARKRKRHEGAAALERQLVKGGAHIHAREQVAGAEDGDQVSAALRSVGDPCGALEEQDSDEEEAGCAHELTTLAEVLFVLPQGQLPVDGAAADGICLWCGHWCATRDPSGRYHTLWGCFVEESLAPPVLYVDERGLAASHLFEQALKLVPVCALCWSGHSLGGIGEVQVLGAAFQVMEHEYPAN
jgi:hypothetical protein